MQLRTRAGALSVSSIGALLAVLAHRPATTAPSPDDPTAAIVVAAAWIAWVLIGYLCVAVAISSAGHLVAATSTTKSGRRISRRLVPRALRHFVDVAVGASAAVVVVTAAAPVAAYAQGTPSPAPPAAGAATAAALEWPGLTPRSTPRPALLTSPARRHSGPPADLVVRAGDSLWSLTARLLGPGASTAEVAAAWPRLYAANRSVIGTDPALIHPGQRLVPPAPEPRSPR